MKHQIIRILVGVGLLTGGIAFAANHATVQKVELQDIVSPTKVEYDSVWYARQAEGWAKEIKKNPKSVKQDSATYKMLTNLVILLIMAYICHLKKKHTNLLPIEYYYRYLWRITSAHKNYATMKALKNILQRNVIGKFCIVLGFLYLYPIAIEAQKTMEERAEFNRNRPALWFLSKNKEKYLHHQPDSAKTRMTIKERALRNRNRPALSFTPNSSDYNIYKGDFNLLILGNAYTHHWTYVPQADTYLKRVEPLSLWDWGLVLSMLTRTTVWCHWDGRLVYPLMELDVEAIQEKTA